MKYVRFSCLCLVTIAIFVISLAGFIGCKGNDVGNTITSPKFEGVARLPLEVTIDQIYAEYMADEAAADGKYKGERLLFYGIVVEEVSSYIDPDEGLFMYNTYIIVDSAKFTPKYTDYLDNVRDGFIVDVVGECRGLIWPLSREPLLSISDCWINTIEGEVIEDWYPDY